MKMALGGIAPCKYCCDRTLGCHGDCKDYMAWKAKFQKEKQEDAKTKKRAVRLSDFNNTTPPPGKRIFTRDRAR